jgi:type IV secretion system protein VirD4
MAALVSFVLLAVAFTPRSSVNPYLHGSARWADECDIKAAGLLNNDGVYVGAWRDKHGTVSDAKLNATGRDFCQIWCD